MDQFEIPLDEDGKILDFLSESVLEPKPEEFVRQHYQWSQWKKWKERQEGCNNPNRRL